MIRALHSMFTNSWARWHIVRKYFPVSVKEVPKVCLEIKETTMNEPDNISLNELEHTKVKVRTPKRVLHFSDGVLEEYSDDEPDSPSGGQTNTNNEVVDTSALSWTSWMIYKAWSAGTVALSACDYVGEGLAYFFGITTPKYWAEIEEYKRTEAEKLQREKEAEGWSEPAAAVVTNSSEIQINQPATAAVV
ncbi:hypothetical protein FQR65_LT12976 [Abscondita terminalis]|nr:hypothetical protein FQR65_LT12976 [Abscondita terminalis]